MNDGFDLNAVRTFVLLYEQRSVTATAQSLHVTQPTVSYTLQKLRRRFADRLFIRGPQGFTPTPRATALYEPLRQSLTTIEQAVSPPRRFEASTSARRFTLALTDIGEVSLLPRILESMKRAAPSTSVAVTPLDIETVEDKLLRGEIDAFIASPEIPTDRITRIPLFREDYLGMVRRGHPRIGARPVDAQTLAAEHFASVVGHSGHISPIRALRTQGLLGRVALEVERFAAVPYVLARTDLVALLPRNAAEVFAGAHRVVLFDPPWHIDPIEVALYTRHPYSRTPAQDWLADVIVQRLQHVVA